MISLFMEAHLSLPSIFPSHSLTLFLFLSFKTMFLYLLVPLSFNLPLFIPLIFLITHTLSLFLSFSLYFLLFFSIFLTLSLSLSIIFFFRYLIYFSFDNSTSSVCLSLPSNQTHFLQLSLFLTRSMSLVSEALTLTLAIHSYAV